MQFTYLAGTLFAALAAAQSSSVTPSATATSSGSTASSTSLPDLVAQLPKCALDCLNTGASSAGCAVTDFTCICGTGKQSFITSAGICVATSSCSSSDQSKLQTLASEICNDVSNGASSSDIASASAVVTSALGTAAASASSTTGSNAAATPMIGYGLMGGAAALAALAL